MYCVNVAYIIFKNLPFRGLQPCQPWKALNHGLQLITATPLPKIKKIHRFFMYLLNLLVLDNNVLKSIGKQQKIKPILALTFLPMVSCGK